MEGGEEMTAIPSEDDFARAKRKMADRDRNLDQVRANVQRRIAKFCPLHSVHILWQRDVDFRVYIFFNEDKDIKMSQENGVRERIENCVYEELANAGRGHRDVLVVAFVYDSDENVSRNYGGDYLLRLR